MSRVRDVLGFLGMDLRSALRARGALGWVVLSLGALALTLAFAPGASALAGTWFAWVVGGLALLLAAAGGALLPGDRLEGRAAWLATLGPSAARRRAGAALACAALAVGGALAAALTVGLLAPPLHLARETLAARSVRLSSPLSFRDPSAAGAPRRVRIDLGSALESAARLEVETRPRVALTGTRSTGPVTIAYAAGGEVGSVEVPWRGRLSVPLVAGTRTVDLDLVLGDQDLLLVRGWVLGTPRPFLLSWLWAGLLLGLAAACVAPLAVTLSRVTSGPTAAGAALVVVLVAGMRSVLPEASLAAASGAVERVARTILETALALAPDLSGLSAAAEPAAGRALGPGCLLALVPLVPHALAWSLLLLTPGIGRQEEQA